MKFKDLLEFIPLKTNVYLYKKEEYSSIDILFSGSLTFLDFATLSFEEMEVTYMTVDSIRYLPYLKIELKGEPLPNERRKANITSNEENNRKY